MHYFLIIFIAINTPDAVPNAQFVSVKEYSSKAPCKLAMSKARPSEGKVCIPAEPRIKEWMRKKGLVP